MAIQLYAHQKQYLERVQIIISYTATCYILKTIENVPVSYAIGYIM